uniref:KN17 SH3-like C-terminal domain-containing protein n=1 Tax=Kalanchoe fedtschenkoi TaxID=63787 RepID=A0A7N0SVQ6_KALFE
MTYIDRDSETLFKERLKNKRLKSDIVEEEKMEREIQKQIQKAEQSMPVVDSKVSESAPAELKKPEDGAKIAFALGSSSLKPSIPEKKEAPKKVLFEETEDDHKEKGKEKSAKSANASGGSSALDELMKEQEKAKERSNRKDYWLHEGIVVKVMSKALADKGYYKQKGVVERVIDKYVGEIEMLENKHKLRVDQEELETVIPQIGGLVRIVNGAYRGSFARLLSVNMDKFCAKVQIEKGIYDGRVLPAVEYEDICKVAQ